MSELHLNEGGLYFEADPSPEVALDTFNQALDILGPTHQNRFYLTAEPIDGEGVPRSEQKVQLGDRENVDYGVASNFIQMVKSHPDYEIKHISGNARPDSNILDSMSSHTLTNGELRGQEYVMSNPYPWDHEEEPEDLREPFDKVYENLV